LKERAEREKRGKGREEGLRGPKKRKEEED
jgi:hypothetical protein